MFSFLKKFFHKPSVPVPDSNLDLCPRNIVFREDDPPLKRAENIWFILGFANDRLNAIPQIATFLQMYKEWDENRIRKEKDENSDGGNSEI